MNVPKDRKTYLQAQKEVQGRHLFGVFPAYFPREILWAMNILPVEIWDPPLEISRAGAHLQPYICSVVKGGLELILQGKCKDLDGFLFPHTCDSLQNLASIVKEYLDITIPCIFFYHPKAPYRTSSRAYYGDQLRGLVDRLEKVVGPLDPLELKRRLTQGRVLTSIFRKVYDLRAAGDFKASNAAFYRIMRLVEFLHPDDYIPLLEDFVDSEAGPAKTGPPIILSGVLPHPETILSRLDELGLRVADDDLLNCGRRLLAPPGEEGDPFESLAERYFGMPPCPTKNSTIKERIGALMEKVEKSGAKGVLFNMVKFCEPEWFDLPLLLDALKQRGVASLVIDAELNQGLSGQIATRIEAFAEMIG